MSAHAIAPSAPTRTAAAPATQAAPPAGDLFSMLMGMMGTESQASAGTSAKGKAPAADEVDAKDAPASEEAQAEPAANDDKPAVDTLVAASVVIASPLPPLATSAAVNLVQTPAQSAAAAPELAPEAATKPAAAAPGVAPAVLALANGEDLAVAADAGADLAPIEAPRLVTAQAAPADPSAASSAPKAETSPQMTRPGALATSTAAAPKPPAPVPPAAAVGQAAGAVTASAVLAQASAAQPSSQPAVQAPIQATTKPVGATSVVTKLSGKSVAAPSASAVTDVRGAVDAAAASPHAIASVEDAQGAGLGAGLETAPDSDAGAMFADAELVDAQADAPTAQPSAFQASMTRDGAVPAAATSGTVANLAAQIAKRADGRSSRFDIELDPDGLGRVSVQLKIDARGRLSATLAFDRPESAEALKARAGELRLALEQSGFDLSGAGLRFESDAGGRFAGAFGHEGREADARGRGRAFSAVTKTAELADQTPATRAQAARGLDIRI